MASASPRPRYEHHPYDTQDDVLIAVCAERDWLDAELKHLRLVIREAHSSLDGGDETEAWTILKHAMKREEADG